MNIRNIFIAVATVIVLGCGIGWITYEIGNMLSFKVAMTLAAAFQLLSAYRISNLVNPAAGFSAFAVSMIIIVGVVPSSWVYYLGGNAILFIPYTLEKMRKEGSLTA